MIKQKKKINKLFSYENQEILNQFQKTKTSQKFQSYKALGSQMISKRQLRRVLLEMGKQINQTDLLQMIYQADPNGHGHISSTAFQNIVSKVKQLKEENINVPIGLTFEQILRIYLQKHPQKQTKKIPTEFIEIYMQQNFGLRISIQKLKSIAFRKQVTKQEFIQIFA